ncbi:MAG: chlorobactene glucosyltransferase [Acidobacteriota bacterium]|jgi:chlorobactene glucosyltransferase|nr:chlorobactene glucosyltransferase [Acidobacteriota bacterium]
MRFLALAVLAFWLLTLGRTILNLLLVPRLRAGAMPRETPRVSVIVPARDEERSIERTVRALLAQTYPELEVVVVNDRSTDATGAILGSIGDPRLVVVNGVEPPLGWLGKPHALHLGAARATGELLLFIDADIIYAPDAVAAAVARLEKSGASMLSLLPHFDLHGFWEHVAIPNLLVVAFTMLPLWLANKTRIPLFGAGGGPGNLIRRQDYDAIGGHESLKDAVVDDVALARLVRRSGRRSEVALANDLISLRMYHGLREIVDGFTKNSFAVFNRNYVAAVVVLLLAVIGHALPYALAVTGDLIGIATVALIVLSRVVLYSALRYRLDNALFGHVPMMLIWCWILIRSMWVTGVKRQLTWRGRTYDAEKTRFGAD